MIREAQPTDVRAIHSFVKAGVIEGSLVPRSKKNIRKHIKSFVVAEHSGQPVGCCSIEQYTKNIAEIRSLYVAPDHRHNGIANDMILDRVAKTRQKTIFAITPSPVLFEKVGFTPKQQDKSILFWRYD